MVSVRRKLPLTRGAHQVKRTSRIERSRILPRTRSSAPRNGRNSGLLHHGPDEAGEAARDRDRGDGGALSAVHDRPVRAVQVLLGAQCRREDRRRLPGEALGTLARAGRAPAIGPGRLDQNAPQMRVAALGDGPLAPLGPAGVLALGRGL